MEKRGKNVNANGEEGHKVMMVEREKEKDRKWKKVINDF